MGPRKEHKMSKPLERFAVFSLYKGNVQYSLLLFENLGFEGVCETIKQRKSGMNNSAKQSNVHPEQLQTFASWTNNTEAAKIGAPK